MACLVVLLLCVLATAKTSSIADTILRNNPYPSVNASNVREFARYLTSELKNTVFESEHTGVNAPFPCNSSGRSVPTPTDARKLKPADVDVVITLGDSVAAGFGALATSIFGVFTEYRGHTFCNGGEPNYDTYVTVPNILKIYNPNLKGYSIGTGGAGSKNAKLNVAVSGARSYDLSSQYEMLLNQLTSEGIAPTDWKVITIFVGGNDLCDYCSDTTKNSPANWKKNMELIVDLIMANIPRVFLNLVAPPDVTLLGQVSEGFCSLLHGFECGCATDASTHTAHKEYTAALESLIELPKYQTKEDFYVTLQPFLKDMVLPSIDGKPDRSYFAPDCFHFSGKAHEAAAVALWNNMVEEKAKKKTSWVPGEPLECSEGFLM